MAIHSVKGYLKDIAPDISEAVVLWIYTNFTGRECFWRDELPQLCEYVSSVVPREGVVCKDFNKILPWFEKVDSMWQLKPASFKKLKYVYVFANPLNSPYLTDFDQVDELIIRSFTTLKAFNVKSVSIIHIPASKSTLENRPIEDQLSGNKTNEDDMLSAKHMVNTIKWWMEKNGEMEVYLVDRLGDFDRVVLKE